MLRKPRSLYRLDSPEEKNPFCADHLFTSRATGADTYCGKQRSLATSPTKALGTASIIYLKPCEKRAQYNRNVWLQRQKKLFCAAYLQPYHKRLGVQLTCSRTTNALEYSLRCSTSCVCSDKSSRPLATGSMYAGHACMQCR